MNEGSVSSEARREAPDEQSEETFRRAYPFVSQKPELAYGCFEERLRCTAVWYSLGETPKCSLKIREKVWMEE